MDVLRRWWWVVVLALLVLIVWWSRRPEEIVNPVSTRLELESDGAFEYVASRKDNALEIAYLNDVKVPGCEIDQLGTDLRVVDGTIVEVVPGPAPANKEFDLERATVTFPGLHAGPLTAVRGNRPTAPPGNPSDPAEWADLKWVAGIGQDFPNSSLHPNWRTLVNGRLVLRGGTLTGLPPSSAGAQNGTFEFKADPPNAKTFTQAITDRTLYVVDVPADRVVMHLGGAASKVTRIVVTPSVPGQPVRLKMIGRHAQGTPRTLVDGMAVMDFCPFYQLLQPVPPASEWLIPHYRAAAAAGIPKGGSPNPGPFCPPNYSPEP